MKIIPTRPNTAFTRVPHSITFSEILTAHQKMVWIMLDANCYNQETEVGSAAKVAKKLGLPARGLQRTIQELIAMGFITKDGDEYSLQVEPSQSAESTGAVKRRSLTRDEMLRLELKDIWNKYKPKNAPSMQDFTPARLRTLRVYVKRLQADEKTILRKVCDGSNADDFRRDKDWDFGNIFGHGVPTEAKQTTCEKVYRKGCTQKAVAAGFDRNDDQSWLNWFASKGHKQFTKVERIEMERFAAWKHEDNEGAADTIYIYNEGDSMVHWTYKESQCGVSYLPTAN